MQIESVPVMRSGERSEESQSVQLQRTRAVLAWIAAANGCRWKTEELLDMSIQHPPVCRLRLHL